MRPPVCEICDAEVDPSEGAGGLVRFQPDDRSRAWRRRIDEDPRVVGHPPDCGWFCDDHVDAARAAARTMGHDAALRHLAADAATDTTVTTGATGTDATGTGTGTGTDATGTAGGVDRLDLDSDLVGVDLGAGRIEASEVFDLGWVAWDLDATDAHVVAASLRSMVPALFEALGLGEAPLLERRTTRTWTPMDGAQPPWCPFTDSTFDEGVGPDGTRVAVQVVLEHWNDDDVANATVSLSIGDQVSITAHGGAGRLVDAVRLWRPTVAAVVALTVDLVEGR